MDDETPPFNPPIRQYELICAKDVVMRANDWLWPGHLIRGGQEIMTGVSDLGKSQIHCGYAACLTGSRDKWPDGTPIEDQVRGKVIMVTAEDSQDQTLKPRLIAAGADCDRVFFLKSIKKDKKDRMFLLSEDIAILEQIIRDVGDVALVTLDPITAFMGGKLNSHQATDVRSQLGPLKDLSERTNVAFSTITHPAKNAGPNALDHFIASQAFIAAARVGHLCVKEIERDENGKPERDGNGQPKYTGRFLFTNPKHTSSVAMPTLAYTIEALTVGQDPKTGKSITAPYVVWNAESVNITADQALTTRDERGGGRQQSGADAQEFLRVILANGPMRATKIEELAAIRGITEKRLRTASEKLFVIKEREGGFAADGYWMWTLPGTQTNLPF